MIKAKIFKIMAMALCALTAHLAWSQPYCEVRTYTIRDGLAANLISGFAQSEDGLMWFSTWNGLCYYDGYHFATFRSKPGAGQALSTNRVSSVKASSEGNLWCITSDRRVYLFDTRKAEFVDVGSFVREKFGVELQARNVYPLRGGVAWITGNGGQASYRVVENRLGQADGIEQYSEQNGQLRSNMLRKVEQSADGSEWIFDREELRLVGSTTAIAEDMEYMVETDGTIVFASTTGSAYAFDIKKRTMRPIALPKTTSRISDAALWTEGRVALATDQGVVVVDGRTLSTRLITVQTPAQPSGVVTAMSVDSKGRLWTFTEHDGVVMLDSMGAQPRWLMAEAATPWQQTQSARPIVHEDMHGTVWLTPRGGTFAYYDEREQRLVPYALSTNKTDSYRPQILKWMFDDEGNMWFTGTRDLCRVNFGYRHFRLAAAEPGNEVRSLLIDSKGRTWVGASNGLLALHDANGLRMGYLGKDGRLQQERTAFANRIYALAEDTKGRIWIGTKGDGLYVVGNDGSVEHYVHKADDPQSLSNNDVYDIIKDKQGRMWLATYDGGPNIAHEHDGAITFINKNNALKQYPTNKFGRVRRIEQTSTGVMMLATTNGLVTFDGNQLDASAISFHTTTQTAGDTASLMAPDVLQTLATSDGRVFVATLGGGVQEITSGSLLSDNLRLRTLPGTTQDDGIVQSMVADGKGNVWLVRENSIDQYNPATGVTLRYGPGNIGDGIELSEARPACHPETDDLYVGTRSGYVRFNASDLSKSTYRPNIVFTQVLYHGSSERQPILNREVLDVPANRRNLTIYFAALEYTHKDEVQYAYKIEGTNEGWSYVGQANSASFNRLPAGRYKLLVRSTNSDGVWVDNTTALNIYAHPTFWETGWAVALYVVLACMVVWVAIAIYRLRARAKLERDMNEMKTQFFTEISHKLRTPLTLIGGPVAEVLRGESLGDTARKHLEMVERNAVRMLELVNKMLRYGKDHSVYISDDNAAEQTAAAASEASVNASKSNDASSIGNAASTLGDNVSAPDAPSATTADNSLGNDITVATPAVPSPNAMKLLVVEDNDDLRDFLVGILSSDYNVLQAPNGQKGLEMAESQLPDFIITDVMMPVMDGLTMVRRIKQNKDTCHIPIIVLSAKASLDDRLQGLKEGIDDYITKPFNATYLKTRVANIIGQRRMLQQTYVGQLNTEDKQTYQLESPQIVDADNEMMKRLLSYLEENISNPDLRIEDLADAVNLGRSVFYGKVKSIVGMSPVDFVRYLRIQRAEELIKKSSTPISQIAYSVGFADPKYFGRCFKKETGMTPSEYRAKAK